MELLLRKILLSIMNSNYVRKIISKMLIVFEITSVLFKKYQPVHYLGTYSCYWQSKLL